MPTPPKPKVVEKRITAWSFSRYRDYCKCPEYAFHKHVQKMKEPGGLALDRGTAIHKLAELFAKAKKTAKCPEELACFEQEFRQLQKLNVNVEEEWAFTDQWEETGWFDKDAWCRVKIDCHFISKERNICVIIDHKTGKINPDHDGQTPLYALTAMLKYPTIDGADIRLWYLDHGVEKPDEEKIYTRADIPALKKEWEGKIKKMLADRLFKPTPNDGCRWCFYSKAKGGPCQY